MVGPSLLSVKDLCFERDDTQIIDSVCLDLSDGEILQIEGPNGSGKTTLLRLLTSALTPTRGNIYYRGKALSECRFEYLSDLLFLGHQSAVKVTLSAEENLSWMTGPFDSLRRAFIGFGQCAIDRLFRCTLLPTVCWTAAPSGTSPITHFRR